MLLAHTFVQKIRIMANKVTDMSKIRKVIKFHCSGKIRTQKLIETQNDLLQKLLL
jgi:hypothetical protein